MPSLFHKFVQTNIALSKQIERIFPQSGDRLERHFEEDLARCVKSKVPLTIADIGGGRSSPGIDSRLGTQNTRLIAVDISPSELALNRDARLKVCADASRGLPFADNSIDVLTSRFLIEHLPDTETFVAETGRVAAPDGLALHMLAGKYTPFSLLGRLLPAECSRKLVRRIYPAQVGILGYTVHYDHCSWRAFKKLLKKHGFTVAKAQATYHQSAYAYAFFPLFVVSACYDALVHLLGIRTLAAGLYVCAEAFSGPEKENSERDEWNKKDSG